MNDKDSFQELDDALAKMERLTKQLTPSRQVRRAAERAVAKDLRREREAAAKGRRRG